MEWSGLVMARAMPRVAELNGWRLAMSSSVCELSSAASPRAMTPTISTWPADSGRSRRGRLGVVPDFGSRTLPAIRTGSR